LEIKNRASIFAVPKLKKFFENIEEISKVSRIKQTGNSG
jgi:hypothetical protein